ncbi:MAG: alkaline phosphatase family protein [Mycobacteriales bacterium]
MSSPLMPFLSGRWRRPRQLVAAGLIAVFAAGCAASTGSSTASPSGADSGSSSSALPDPLEASPGQDPATNSPDSAQTSPAIDFRAGKTRPEKVLVVIEENKRQQTAIDQMPYLASLTRKYGYAKAYRAVTHPSLPNYLAIIGGSTFGVTTNGGPDRNPVKGPSLLDTAIARGYTAKTYAETMPSNCFIGPQDPYAVKHNPWAYFTDATSRANCKKFDVPAGTPASGELRRDIDAGTLPTLGLLVPDLCHDGHDCSLKTADDYLRSWLDRVIAGPDYRGGRLAIIVTFDEDDGSADNTVLTAVISPRTKGVVSDEPFTHYSLARYLAQLIRTNPPGEAAAAPQLRSAFGI